MVEWLKANWIQIGVIALGVHTLLKAIADALDKDPTTQNKFEQVVEFIGKIISYVFGKRSS